MAPLAQLTERALTAPALEEAGQRLAQMPELLEVVVVRDLAAQPLPDRFDRIQVGAVGRQEAESQARVGGGELEEAGAAMPGRSIEDEHHQDAGIGPQELLAETLEVDGG